MDKIQRASQRIAERLTWCTAHRDQAGIAKDLAEGKDISEVYGLGEAGLFDEFFYFLDQFDIMDLFMELDPKHTERTSNVSFPSVILIYLMRIAKMIPLSVNKYGPTGSCSISMFAVFDQSGPQKAGELA